MEEILKSLPDSELKVMMIIWNNERKMSTGEILSELKNEVDWKLSTLQVILTRLTEKGFLENEKVGRNNYYFPKVEFSKYSKHETQNFVRKMYNNSSKKLIASLIEGDDKLTDEDIAYVRDFVYNKKLKGHACLNETAVMMVINGEHVKLERCQAESGLPTHRTDYLKDTGVLSSTRFWGVEYPNSYQGDHPMGANERIGKVLLQKRIEHQAEACRILKMDDRILEWNDEWNKRSEWCQPKI